MPPIFETIAFILIPTSHHILFFLKEVAGLLRQTVFVHIHIQLCKRTEALTLSIIAYLHRFRAQRHFNTYDVSSQRCCGRRIDVDSINVYDEKLQKPRFLLHYSYNKATIFVTGTN